MPNGDQIVAAMLLPLKLKRTYIYDREGKLLNAEVSGLDLARLSPGMQGQFTPETLRRQRIQELSLLPDKPVQPGDTWQRTTEIELGAGQALQVVTDYSYRGLRDRDGAQLDLLVSEIRSVDFLLKPGAPLPLKITDSNVKPVNSSGQVWFDREAGQIVAASNRLQALGTLTLSSGGMSIEGKIDLTILTNSAARPKSDDDDEGDPAADGDSSDSRGNKAGGDAGSRG